MANLAAKNIEMRQHLFHLLSNRPLSKYLIGTIIDYTTYDFFPDIEVETQWEWYNWICKELKVKDRVVRTHGMDSVKASSKKNYGHDEEKRFETNGRKVKKGNGKTDLVDKDGNSYASIKAGKKIQWGMHVINALPERFQELFSPWICTFGKNYVSLDQRIKCADEIINKLNNKEFLYDLLNYYMRKEENVPYLIIKDLKEDEYLRVDYEEFINVMCDNITFYYTKKKVKISAKIKLFGDEIKRNTRTIFEIEPRSDKNSPILLHGTSKFAINMIKHYNIDVKEKQ